MTRAQQIIERAGGTYLGVQEQMVWFNEPETHSTMVVSLAALNCLKDDLALELVRILMDEKRQVFSGARRAAGVAVADSTLQISDSSR